MFWLGPERGFLIDWLTQQWVTVTGHRTDTASAPWLEGPTAPTTGVGTHYFAALADAESLVLQPGTADTGILPDFAVLRGPTFDPDAVDPEIRRFYARTKSYELDAWAHWCGLFQPLGGLLAVLFSRRLQQLNVPLTGLDTSEGITNEIFLLRDPATGETRRTAWYRHLRGSGHVLYAGFYSVCAVPGHQDPCVKVVFPLPHGNAVVLMRTEAFPDGSFRITSAGEALGDPGFVFTVRERGGGLRARYVRALRESIHVFAEAPGRLRARHVLTFFGIPFLRIHYRMRRTDDGGSTP